MEQKTKRLWIRLSPDEEALFRRKAARYKTVSAMVRDAVRQFDDTATRGKIDAINRMTDLYLKHQQDIKVLATDIDVFSCGNMVEAAQLTLKEKLRRHNPDKTVSAARARIGEGGYNLIHNNREHFVNEVVFGEKISEQELEVRRKWQRFHSDQ